MTIYLRVGESTRVNQVLDEPGQNLICIKICKKISIQPTLNL